MTVTNNQSWPPSPQPRTGGQPGAGWGTAHHSLLAMNLPEALTISGLILPIPLNPEWGFGHFGLNQTPQRIYVEAGSLQTWTLQKPRVPDNHRAQFLTRTAVPSPWNSFLRATVQSS